jgi:tetratricopeptide (TPR) repeat protein
MITIERWTGREAKALRLARRMTLRAFATHLGIAERTLSTWEMRGPSVAIRDVNQQALDTSLRLAEPEARERFVRLVTVADLNGTDMDVSDEHQTGQVQPTAEAARDAADVDLVHFASVLNQPGIGAADLTATELACERLDQDFARMRPDDVLVKIRMLTKHVLPHLRQPQTLSKQERLVALAARLAGLRAWACFDIDDHREAERWYDVAIGAAQEAEAWGLGAWLLGAQSLIPWHRRNVDRTVELIERGVYFANRGSDGTTRAWLYGLQARARAGLGDRGGFDEAFALAQEAAEFSSDRDRRHGMDFDHGALDLRYYAGTSRLLLQQPQDATSELRGSLNCLPVSHTKARAVLTLALADAAMQSDDIDQAVHLTRQALASTSHQPIMPVLQQARRIRRLVQQRHPSAGRSLDDVVQQFTDAMTVLADRAGS